MSHKNAIQADSLRSWTRSEILTLPELASARLSSPVVTTS